MKLLKYSLILVYGDHLKREETSEEFRSALGYLESLEAQAVESVSLGQQDLAYKMRDRNSKIWVDKAEFFKIDFELDPLKIGRLSSLVRSRNNEPLRLLLLKRDKNDLSQILI